MEGGRIVVVGVASLVGIIIIIGVGVTGARGGLSGAAERCDCRRRVAPWEDEERGIVIAVAADVGGIAVLVATVLAAAVGALLHSLVARVLVICGTWVSQEMDEGQNKKRSGLVLSVQKPGHADDFQLLSVQV